MTQPYPSRHQTTIPVVVTDHQGIITEVNGPFTDVFGWSAEEVVGQNVSLIIPKSFHDSHQLGFGRFRLTHRSEILNHPLVLKGMTKDGREIESEHYIVAEQHQGRWVFMAFLRPLHLE